nr:MAG TPA: hypothetical protein [Caudoviricetes sp.]
MKKKRGMWQACNGSEVTCHVSKLSIQTIDGVGLFTQKCGIFYLN